MTDEATLDPLYAPGTVLANRYRVIARLGEGGMGIVLKATQIDLDRTVALKLLLPEFRANLQVIERFFREAKAAARVQGDHVARILDVGKLENGEPFIAMEFLEGEDLGKLLEREGRLSVDVATTYMLHACTAVAEAHAARVVHRDLKPQNLFLARGSNGKSVLKVLDFGISRVDDAASNLTQTASALGTAFYMAPEQITAPKTIDVRADIWSLGVVYYELITGKTPFDGDTLPQVVAHVIKNERARASDVVPGVPSAVDAIIERCLAPEPAARFQTAVELAASLAALGRNEEDAQVVKRLRSLPPPPPSLTNETAVLPRAASYRELAETALPESEPQVPDLELDLKNPSIPRSRPVAALPAPSTPRQIAGGNIALDVSPSPKIELDEAPAQYARHVQKVKLRRQGLLDEEDEAPRRGRWRALVIAFVILALPPLAVFFVAPRVIGARIDAAAARAGLAITHDAPSISLTGVDLKNLHVVFDKAKDTEILARSAHAAFAGDDLTLHDVEVKSSTPIDALSHAFADVDAAIPWSVDFEGLSFEYAWKPDTTLTCKGKFSTRIAVTSRNAWLECADARLKTPRGEAGPFALSIDRTHGLWGGSIAAPDAMVAGIVPTASLVTNGHGSQFNAEIPHVSLARLHLAPTLFGLPEKDNPDVDLKIEARGIDGKIDGGGTFTLRDATIGAATMDVTWDFSIASNDAGIAITNKTAKIGPFPAQITGALHHGAEIAFRASYPCAEVARGRRTHARSTGATILPSVGGISTETGDVHLVGTITFNAMDLALAAKLDRGQSTADTCGLLIFPRKL